MKYLSIFLVILLSACAHNNHSFKSTESVNQAIESTSPDWSELAQDIANKTYDSMKELNQLKMPLSVIHEQDSHFSIMLHELIVTSLVDKGVIVKANSNNQLYLKHDVDYVTLDESGEYYKASKVANLESSNNVKVLINASLIKGDIYFMRKSDLYHVNASDIKLHSLKQQHQAKTLKVVN